MSGRSHTRLLLRKLEFASPVPKPKQPIPCASGWAHDKAAYLMVWDEKVLGLQI